MTNLHKLPKFCVARLKRSHNPSDDSLILIKRGESGYWPAGGFTEDYNERRGITKDQVEAMLIGSMFGWDVPGADPDWHVEDDEEPRGTTPGCPGFRGNC